MRTKGAKGHKYSPEQRKEIAEKKKRTMIANYGENYKEIIKQKTKNSLLKKYGVDNASKLESVKEKKKQTLLKNYGVTSPLKSEKIKDKAKQTCIERYGTDYYAKSEKFKKEHPIKVKPVKLIIPFKFERCIFCGYIVTVERHSNRRFVSCDNCLEKGLKVRMPKGELELRSQKTKHTCQEKYGADSYLSSKEGKDRVRNTLIEKYGVENVFQSEMIKQKIKNSMVKRYGVENPSQNEDIKNKKIQTSFTHYGTKHPNQNPQQFQKHKDTMLKKYGVEHPYQKKEIIEKIALRNRKMFLDRMNIFLEKYNIICLEDYLSETNVLYNSVIDFKCLVCDTVFKSSFVSCVYHGRGCPICNPIIPHYVSKPEHDIADFLKSLGVKKIINSDRKTISPQELDILLPEYNIAIEFDGLYWHSEQQGKDLSYHLDKTERCLKQNIQLIHIFEDEWILKQDIVKARLKQILKLNDSRRIHARKCIIKEIDAKTKNEFLEKYHIQGQDRSTLKLGAFYNDELVSVMTFSYGNIAKGSKKIEGVWELNRFCSDPNYHIPGIASKMFTYFKRNFDWQEIFSYADRRWSIGKVYEKLGFELDHITQPNYWYIKGFERIHRFNLRKKPDEPKNISERILRLEEGYNRIWDCGNLKYILRTK